MNIQTDRALLPAHASVVRYLVVSVTAPACERRTERPAVEVALVLDRSGSMGGSKIQLAKQAVEHAIQLLHERDRLAVVCYDTEVDTLLGSTTATAEAKALASSRLRGIDARGGTDLCGGWQRGAKELEAHVPAARAEALDLNRRNEFERASDVLRRAAAAIRVLAPGIQQVQTVADALEGDQVDYQAMMSLSEQKARHFASRSALFSRSATGRARKG